MAPAVPLGPALARAGQQPKGWKPPPTRAICDNDKRAKSGFRCHATLGAFFKCSSPESFVARSAARSILMFHGIGTPLSELEDGEENYWIDWKTFDSVVDYCARLPEQADRFTFDDGNLSDVEAARHMRRHGIGGYFFVLVGRIGKPGYLDVDNIHELISLGMEIGLHGRDHRDWRKVDDATLFSEIDLAAEELEAICGREIDTLSVPFGAYDKRVWSYLERSKVSRIYTSDRGVSPKGSRFVRRNSVTKWQNLYDIRAVLHDVASPTAKLRRTVMPVFKRSL